MRDVNYHKTKLFCTKCKKEYEFEAMENIEKVISLLHCPKGHYKYKIIEVKEKPSYQVKFLTTH